MLLLSRYSHRAGAQVRAVLAATSLALLPLLATAQHHLDLRAQTLNIPHSSFQVTRVVDARADRSRLGAVYLGMDNHVASADFAQPLEAELLALLQRTPPSLTARPVVLRIHTLSIGETIRATAETGVAELVADILVESEPGAYYLLLSVGELVEGRGADVTRQHPQNLAQTLQLALTQLAALPADARGVGPALSWAAVEAGRGGALAQRYPVQTEPLRQGVYRSFAEFRANAPTGGQEQPFTLAPVKRKGGLPAFEASYLYLGPQKPSRLVRGAWGVSDGRTAYVFQQGAYYALQADSTNAAYTFTVPAPADPHAMTMAAIAGGLAGVALAGAISGGEPLPCEVRLATGRVMAAPRRTAPASAGAQVAPDSATVYLYRRPDAHADQLLTLTVDGKPFGTLAPGQCRMVRWADRRHELSLCASGASGEAEACHRFVPDFSAPTFVQCSLPAARAAEPLLQPVPAKEGQFYVKLFRQPRPKS